MKNRYAFFTGFGLSPCVPVIRSIVLSVLLVLANVPPLFAQESGGGNEQSTATPVVPQPTEPNEDKGSILELSPFEVVSGKDSGYVATSSLSGGRLATDLDKTPAAVSVITRELLDDLGVFNTQQTLQWTTNVVGTTDTDEVVRLP